jgi:hypothetical protein
VTLTPIQKANDRVSALVKRVDSLTTRVSILEAPAPAPPPTVQYETIGSIGSRTTLTGAEGTLRYKIFRGAVQVTGPAVLEDCKWAGPSGVISDLGRQETLLWVKSGSGAQLLRPEVYGSLWHAGIFLTADDFYIEDPYVHDNGGSPDLNQDHGIYWSAGARGELAGGLIANNRDRGIQIYPNPLSATVHGTEIFGNRTGVQWGDNAAGCVVHDVIVHDNLLYGLRSYALTGQGNIARDSHVWNNGVNLDIANVQALNIVQAAP